MRKFFYTTLSTLLVSSFIAGCGPREKKSLDLKIEKIVSTATLQPTGTPTLTPTESPTPLPEDLLWIANHGFPDNVFKGFTEEQINTYVNMSYEEVTALEHLFLLKEDVFTEKLTPESVLALSNYLSQYDADVQRGILQAPNSPIEMIDSSAHVLGLSDDISHYHIALPWDMLEEYFGLNVLTVFDNSETHTRLFNQIRAEYTDEELRIFRLGSTVEDRITQIEDQTPVIARNYNLDSVLSTLLKREKDNTGPVTLYYVPHMHLGKSKVIFDDFYDKKWYNAKEMFPEEFLREFDGRHLNLVFSTCPAGFVDKLKVHLDKNNVSYTLLYGDNGGNNLQELSLQGFAKATEIVVNTKYLTGHGPKFPAVTFGDLEKVADGTLENAKVRKDGDFLYYTIRPFENYDPDTRERLNEFSQWPAEIEIYLRINPATKKYSPENVDFEVALTSSENMSGVNEYIPLFGMNLEKMK